MLLVENYPVLHDLYRAEQGWIQMLNESDPAYQDSARRLNEAECAVMTGKADGDNWFLHQDMSEYLSESDKQCSFAAGFWLGIELMGELEALGRTEGSPSPGEG